MYLDKVGICQLLRWKMINNQQLTNQSRSALSSCVLQDLKFQILRCSFWFSELCSSFWCSRHQHYGVIEQVRDQNFLKVIHRALMISLLHVETLLFLNRFLSQCFLNFQLLLFVAGSLKKYFISLDPSCQSPDSSMLYICLDVIISSAQQKQRQYLRRKLNILFQLMCEYPQHPAHLSCDSMSVFKLVN